MRICKIGAAVALVACAPSCVTGIIYSDVTLPLQTNLNVTKNGAKTSDSDAKEVHDPFFTGVRVQWDSNAIGDVMRRDSIQTGRFADLRIRSIVFGIWTQQWVRVTGDPVGEKAAGTGGDMQSTGAKN